MTSTPQDCGCASARLRIGFVVDRELNAQECAEVRAHCDTCPECAQELKFVDTLSDKVRDACGECPPEDVKARVFDAVSQKIGRPLQY